jgi:hypothetical protein
MIYTKVGLPFSDRRIVSVMGFHEKAGGSQGNSGFIVSSWFFSTKFLSRRVFLYKRAWHEVFLQKP